MRGERWNSSLHAFELLLCAAPAGAQRAVDVGCGEGETARRLRRRARSVVGLDPDAASIEEARSHDDDIEYVTGDLRSAGLPEASFDLVSAVGMLHHVDHRTGLAQLARLVRPGGTLLVVGMALPEAAGLGARSRSPVHSSKCEPESGRARRG